MAYNYEYPYYDSGRLNIDALFKQVNDLGYRLDGLVEEAVALANAYTDEQVQYFQKQVDDLRAELNQTVIDLQQQYTNFTNIVNARLVFINDRINDLEAEIAADIQALDHNIDLKIEANNDYIIEHLETELAKITVLNYFTGERDTVQDMFNYLAQLHLTDPLTFTQLAAKNIDYDTLAGLYMTYTQLAVQGNAIIP